MHRWPPLALALVFVLAPAGVNAQSTGDIAAAALAKSLLHQAQMGQLDRSQLSPQADAALTDEAIAGMVSQLKPLGEPSTLTLESETGVDELTVYVFHVVFKSAVVEETLTLDASGKVAALSFKQPQ